MSSTYKFLEKNETLEESRIRKENVVVDFTLGDLDKNIERLEKMHREVAAQLTVDKALVKNIARNHPGIPKMRDGKINAAWMYKEAMDRIAAYGPKEKEIAEALKIDKEEKKEIYKQLGLEHEGTTE